MMLDDFGRSASFGIDKVQQIFTFANTEWKIIHVYVKCDGASFIWAIKIWEYLTCN